MGDELLAERFEAHRGHLRAVAYRMLGSTAEAEDAVQEAWLRLNRAGDGGVGNLGGWLTTVVGRVCLDMLRSRRRRGEEPLSEAEQAPGAPDPEQDALLADSVGVALLVVLETLEPAERLAFVLHDMFAVPFDQIAPIVDRSPAAARQLASRARRRVQGAPQPVPEPDLALQRQVVGAFMAAARQGDFEALVAVLDPDVVSRSDLPGFPVRRGAAEVARGALISASVTGESVLALADGRVAIVHGQGTPTYRVLTFAVTHDARIREIDVHLAPTMEVRPLP